ncbi:AMP-binding protein [Rhodococcus opacus]|jgi:acyl-CoA synthetase (AMP-forming)/AMP-acid ligase II|uniref:AMP-binding protein n=1 Tax=Rhodococcus opacus TaxID=37919 RepID=UPI002474915E|nr:AMP-binding protein [Rhodococcus opacus]MDH6293269.1 acyl-CoA synthetase (AMP-forming)/AMP-acid ligase II [Rhodococcus opacus]
MDFIESDEHVAIREAVAAITTKFGPDYYTRHALAHEPTTDLWKALGHSCTVGHRLEARRRRGQHRGSHTRHLRGAVGTPVIGVQAAIMGQDGGLLPAGDEGEIVYRSPHTMTEYLDNPEATAESFAHGWFNSGDIGRFDEDGILWFSDRFKDIIKTGGENVSSLEVGRAIYQADPRIAEATVVGLPHHRWSEAITAGVVPASRGQRSTPRR